MYTYDIIIHVRSILTKKDVIPISKNRYLFWTPIRARPAVSLIFYMHDYGITMPIVASIKNKLIPIHVGTSIHLRYMYL